MADDRPDPQDPADEGAPGSEPADPTEPTEPTEPAWQRRKRLAAVFGDVLPDTTSDERDPDTGDGEAAGDRWLRAQVPPHHG